MQKLFLFVVTYCRYSIRRFKSSPSHPNPRKKTFFTPASVNSLDAAMRLLESVHRSHFVTTPITGLENIPAIPGENPHSRSVTSIKNAMTSASAEVTINALYRLRCSRYSPGVSRIRPPCTETVCVFRYCIASPVKRCANVVFPHPVFPISMIRFMNA